MVRLGMEDRTLMVAEDQRSPRRESPRFTSSSLPTFLCPCLLSLNTCPGLDKEATSSEELEEGEKENA